MLAVLLLETKRSPSVPLLRALMDIFHAKWIGMMPLERFAFAHTGIATQGYFARVPQQLRVRFGSRISMDLFRNARGKRDRRDREHDVSLLAQDHRLPVALAVNALRLPSSNRATIDMDGIQSGPRPSKLCLERSPLAASTRDASAPREKIRFLDHWSQSTAPELLYFFDKQDARSCSPWDLCRCLQGSAKTGLSRVHGSDMYTGEEWMVLMRREKAHGRQTHARMVSKAVPLLLCSKCRAGR